MDARLAAVLVLSTVLAPQDDWKEHRDPDKVKAQRALLAVQRKYESREQFGLYLREPDGTTVRIWQGEPYDSCSLPDKSILIAERQVGRVHWIGPEGEVRFTMDGFSQPVDVEMDEDGRIVVVNNGTGEVLGVDVEEKRVVWRRGGFNDPFDAAPLDGGGLLVADSGNGRILELDRSGEVVREVKGLGFINTVEPLEGDGLLVTTWSEGSVRELDAQGKLVWWVRTGGVVYSAERRWDGLTLVCDGSGRRLIFLDERGKTIRVEPLARGCVDYETIVEL